MALSKENGRTYRYTRKGPSQPMKFGHMVPEILMYKVKCYSFSCDNGVLLSDLQRLALIKKTLKKS